MPSENSLTFQTWGSLLCGALLIAYLGSGHNFGLFAALFVVSFLVLAFVYFAIIRVLARWRKSGELYERIEEELAMARALSLREAEEKALSLLSDGGKYRVVEKPSPTDTQYPLGPVLREFFSRFEKVTEIKGETSLDRSEIRPSTLREGFIKIGTDIEHAEIVARSKEDVIYVIDGTEPDGPQAEEGFPTIYHYLVAGYWTASSAGEKERG
jgi:hypothetical protein